MSAQYDIIISQDAAEAIKRLRDTAGLGNAVARAMDRQNQFTVAHIQRDYLSFPKSGPAQPNGLRVQTNRLRGSIRASKAVPTGDGVQSSIGTNVVYAAIHEFGADIPSRPTRSKNPRYAKLHPVTKAYSIPARAPIQHGIDDRIEEMGAAISSAILDYERGLN